MKWTSRILILAVFLAMVGGCQKGQKAEVSKAKKSSTRTASAGAKAGSKSAKSGTAAKAGSEGEKYGSTRTVRPGTLTMADNGRSFDVKRGEVITVNLEAARSAGFKWSLSEAVGAVLKQEGSPSYVRSTTKSGKGGGVEIWRFRTVGSGRETVRLEYRRPWESIPERAFRFTVVVR